MQGAWERSARGECETLTDVRSTRTPTTSTVATWATSPSSPSIRLSECSGCVLLAYQVYVEGMETCVQFSREIDQKKEFWSKLSFASCS